MMRHIAKIISLCVVLLLTAGLSKANATVGGSTKSEPQIKYEFELNDAARTKLIDGVKSLTYGEPIAQAKKLLGEPDSEKNLIRPTLESLLFGVFGAKPIFVAHGLRYYLKRVYLKQESNRDQNIELMFDSNGYLQDVVYSSMKPVSGEIIYQRLEPAYGFEYYRTKPPMPKADASPKQ
jgi:hypothetical protein